MHIDVPRRQATIKGREVASLSVLEFRLPCTLARELQRVFTRAELIRDVWADRAASGTRTLDGHACRLRTKLPRAGQPLLSNLWSVGYRLLETAEQT